MPLFLKILLSASLPITELRGTIPWFLANNPEIPLWQIFTLAVIGNFLPVLFLLWFLPRFTDFLHQKFHSKNIISRLITWFYQRAHGKHSEKFYKYGALALIIVVAIPLPGTGGWTGSLLAFLFNIPYRKAALLILTGIILAGIIVSFLSLGGIAVFSRFS